MKKVNWNATARSGGKMMVNEYERDAVSDIILIVDSRSISETALLAETHLCTARELLQFGPAFPC